MSIQFLHAADIHLDSPLRGLERYEGAPVDRLRNATRGAFVNLVELALERRVDFVLIAGDLYDGDWRDYNTGLFLTKQLGHLHEAKIPVVMIAGNHDAANKMTKALRLPDRVHQLAADQPESLGLDALDVVVHGQSFAKASVTEDLAAHYPDARRGAFNIGLLHTCLSGAEGHERYAPCTIEGLRSRGYHYWALGHVHRRQVIGGDPPIVFPGNIQGRNVRETGEKGCVIATVRSDQSVATEFHRLDVACWERIRVDASGSTTEDELLQRVLSGLDEVLGREAASDRTTAARVVLHGPTTLDRRLRANPERYVAEVRNLARERAEDRLWVEKVEVQTRSSGPIAVPDGPLATLRDVLEALRADPTGLASELIDLKRRLPPGLLGVDGPRLEDPAWIVDRLDDVQSLLFELIQDAHREGTS